MVYSMNTPADTSEWTRNYTTSGTTSNYIIGLEAQPSLPASAAFYRVAKCGYRNYISRQFQAEGVDLITEAIVYPDKVYSVCNDLTQTNSGFNSRNYSPCLYVDHFLKLTDRKKAKFASTLSDKLPLYAPIATDNSSYNGGMNVKTTVVTDTITGAINDAPISISHISTKASSVAAGFPKILCIGDSVTSGFLADIPYAITTGNPSAYWSHLKRFFQLDKNEAGSGHNSLLLGMYESRSFQMAGQTVKAYAEGRGSWTTRNYLYDQSYAGHTNPFYDSAKSGVKFSLAKYLAQYKTLADDGTTRLVVGNTAGTLVTDVNAYDVCTPTHVVLQLGFNDVEANYAADMALLVNAIKTEYPNIIVIVSTIDAAGTYYPELYPKFSGNNLLNNGLHSKMYNLVSAAKALENTGSKVFYCPNYFIQPTGIAVAYRDANFPESLANAEYSFGVTHGAGADYHPNTYAHAAWGYQLYSLIMYTLTL